MGAAGSLVDLLRCPACGGRVIFRAAEVVCGTGIHRFSVVDGVAVMTDERALEIDPHYGQQRRYFDAEFSDYRRYELEPWRTSFLQRVQAAGLIGSPETTLLDVGVGGSGYTVIEAAKAGGLAVGCDLSLEALRTARRFAAAEGVAERTLWVCCSAERLPFADRSFDSLLAIAVFEHVPDDRAALREAARVLVPQGGLWATTPHALRHISPVFRLPNRVHDHRLGHLRRYEAEELVEIGRAVGLESVDVQFTGHPVKVLQLLPSSALPARARSRFWWWCERRDLRRTNVRRGSMQVSVVFRRSR